MASSITYSLLFILAILISASNAQNGLIFPIRKDTKSSQFYTTIEMGSNRTAINTVLDLGGRYLWFVCQNYTSTTLARIPCGSTKCSQAAGLGCVMSPNDTCSSGPYNPFADFLVADYFYEDTLSSKTKNVRVPQYLFSCMEIYYADGLGGGSTGLLGLGRTNVSLPVQVASKLKLPHVFSICLPSSGLGKLSIGQRSSVKSLKSTPLIINPESVAPVATGGASAEYFLDVKSIRVNGRALNVNSSLLSIDSSGIGGTRFSTVQNYTSLHSHIYRSLTRAFVKAASDLKIRKVAAVEPFRACFSSASISKTPNIDLVLPGTDVYWRITGANALVKVDERTSCLAFLDAGTFIRASIVIGVHQLEENFMEFDLVSSQLKFSNSLLEQNLSCSRL